MKGMRPNTWRPERPASIGCPLGRLYETPKTKAEINQKKHEEEKRKARAELERMFSKATVGQC